MTTETVHLSDEIQFEIEHNLNDYGLNLTAGVINWMVRTDDYSPESLCNYLVSKDPINLIVRVKTNNDEKE